MGNLNPPNIQYSYTLALKETESINFIWKEDSEWTKCDDICNGRFVFVLFGFILYVPSTIFQLNRDGSSWVEPVLS